MVERFHRAGARRFVRAVSWVAVSAAGIVLLASAGLLTYVSYINGKIHVFGSLCVKDCTSRPADVTGTENFLLVGSDTRAGRNSQGGLAGLANGSAGNGLSDTTLLIHISANTGRVIGLSFPRDTYVLMPSFTTKSGARVPAQPEKFNAAYSFGGPQLLVKQIEEFSGLKVDHYVQVDFSGFVNIVNALGGVDVCISPVPGSTTNMRDPGAPAEGTGGSGFVGHAGINHLSGLNALAFVRQRHGLPNGDLDRIQRQHRFLSAIFDKIKSAGTLLNPVRLNRVATSLAQDLSVDSGTRLTDLATLGTHLQNLSAGQVSFYTVPTTVGPNIPGVGAVLEAIPAQAHALFQAIHDDQDPARPTSAASPSPVRSGPPAALIVLPSAVTLDVVNASGITGRGSATASALRALGFTVSSVATGGATPQARTTVRYGSDRADSARTLAAAVPGASLQPDPSLGAQQLVLAVGTGYQGTRVVNVSGAASPADPVHTTPPTSAPGTTAPDTRATDAGGCGP